MKTKEFIRRLQEADPTGEVECCVGNLDIYFVTQEPSYYDGPLQVLVHDESKRDKEYSVIGAKLLRNSSKIQIHTIGIDDAIFDMSYSGKDLPVTIEGDSVDGHYQKMVDKWKEEAKQMIEKFKSDKSDKMDVKTI